MGLATERSIFERSRDKFDTKGLALESDRQFLEFTAKGTLPNRLFLTECRERDIQKNVRGGKDIADVLRWFEDVPSFIFPDSSADLVFGIRTNQEFKVSLGRCLKCFDTGIERIDLEQVDFENLKLPPSFRRRIETATKNKKLLTLNGPEDSHWLFDRDGDGNPRSWKLIAHHKGPNGAGRQATFEIGEESDGTRRLMHLVPAMMALTTTTRELTWTRWSRISGTTA